MRISRRVVARYRDGRVVKGETKDFSPAGTSFTVTVKAKEGPPRARRILMEDLKAIFFVKSLRGDKEYNERKLQAPEKSMGQRVVITFEDGETMRGSTLGINLTRKGFLFFPSDPRSNNNRIFVMKSAVKSIREDE